MSRLVLATANEEFEARVREAFDGELTGPLSYWREGMLLEPGDAVRELSGNGVEVVALGPDVPAEKALALASAFDHQRPDISVVIIAPPSTDLLQSALRAGARDVIAPDMAPADLRAAIERAFDTAVHRRQLFDGDDGDGEDGDHGRVIMALCPKGGAGKTTVSTNLALALAQVAPGEVVIIDLDLQFGDVASSLGLTPTYSMYTATQASGSEAALLKAYLTPHSSQLLVLCAPDDPTEADDVKEGDAVRIVQELARLFAWVIIDTGAGLDDLTLAVAEAASDLILVSSTDVPSVRGIRKESMIMDQLGVRATRHFVLNRSDAKVGLSPADISLATGFTIAASIPSSRSVPTSVNVGVAIIDHDGRNPASRGLSALADLLVESEQNATARKGLRRFRK